MLEDGRKVAVIVGGGTSGPPISDVFCDLEHWHTVSIAPGSDSGGNSGILRDALGILPPGDVRRFLIAHAKDANQKELRELFGFRFPDNHPKFPGEVVGNILASAAEEKWGRSEGVRAFSRLLNIRGEVHYASKQDTHLVARLSDGSILQGEKAIDTRPPSDDRFIKHVWLEPEPIINTAFYDRIRQADVIVLAPGDFYTSLMAILLVTFMPQLINDSSAAIVLVASLMTKKAETHGYTVADFVDKLHEYGLSRLDAVLVNTGPIPKRLRKLYWDKEYSAPVRFNSRIKNRILRREKIKICENNYLSQEALKKDLIRHNPHKVVEDILNLIAI